MKERPILFSAPMVRAILAGWKTQTRRIVKQKETTAAIVRGLMSGGRPAWGPCPFGVPGDQLWVRETWMKVYDCPELPCCEDGEERHSRITYCATEPEAKFAFACGFDCSHDESGCARWRPSIHMPRWASRITLEVTDVRVERLNDISELDACAEGVEELDGTFDTAALCRRAAAMKTPPEDSRVWFAELWESINGEGSWKSNPWVWVVGFKRIEANKERGVA